MAEIDSARRILFVYPEAYFSGGGGIATYLHHAVRALLAAGREVHLLTWLTERDPLMGKAIGAADLYPLKPENVTIVRITDEQILNANPFLITQPPAGFAT